MGLIFRTVHGSHLYGLAHKDSDMDFYDVYEGKTRSLTQNINEGIDVVSGTLDAFLKRAYSGSHQSVEAIFSQEKQWAPGMEEKWGPMIDGVRVGGSGVFKKYERTIKKFSYGDFKRRRHAVRLAFNLAQLRRSGRFNPRLDTEDAFLANKWAEKWQDGILAYVLLERA